jgi:hypothetical protein
VTINWTVEQQRLDDAAQYPGAGKTNYLGSGKNRETNVLQNYKFTFTSVNYNNAQILSLLANSLNTNFPAGTKLETDGSTLFVVEGTNFIDISSVVTATTMDPIRSGLDSTVTTSKASGSTSSSKGNDTGKQIIIVNYDDSGTTTKDGTTTTFTFVGESAFTDSGSSTTSTNFVVNGKESGSFTVHGVGYGSIRNTPSNIQGTIVGAASGTYSIAE